MKRVLFVSPSRLNQNLLRAVLPLVPEKTNLVCVDKWEQAVALPKKGKVFDLVVADSGSASSAAELSACQKSLGAHPLLGSVKKLVLHSPESRDGWGEVEGIADYYPKPLTPDELAGIISRGTRKG